MDFVKSNKGAKICFIFRLNAKNYIKNSLFCFLTSLSFGFKSFKSRNAFRLRLNLSYFWQYGAPFCKSHRVF